MLTGCSANAMRGVLQNWLPWPRRAPLVSMSGRAEVAFTMAQNISRTCLRLPCRVAAVLALAAAASTGFGCNKKKEEKPIALPPPRGAASVDELSTGLGLARGLDANLAPTSFAIRRTLVLDDKRAILAGEAAGEAIVLFTGDAGKTWRSLRQERGAWSSWSLGEDGTVLLASGEKEQPRFKNLLARAPLESVKLWFARFDDQNFSAPWPLVSSDAPAVDAGPPPKRPPPKRYLPLDATAAVFSPELSGFIVEDAPRKTSVLYNGQPNVEAPAPVALPPAERFVVTPYARPGMLLSIKGRDLLVRPVPAPDKPLDAPQKVPNLTMTATLFNELSAPPICESPGFTFQVIRQPPLRGQPPPPKGKPPGRNVLLGISASKIVTIPMPADMAQIQRIGCSNTKVVFETTDLKQQGPTLSLCDFEGTCVTPQKPPFRLWPEEHSHVITTLPTEQGVASVLAAEAGEKWGLYFSQSTDGGSFYEVSRVIGEGVSSRGKIVLQALISFGKRTLLLLTADVTGTSRRGFYVIVSDDGGQTWASP